MFFKKYRDDTVLLWKAIFKVKAIYAGLEIYYTKANLHQIKINQLPTVLKYYVTILKNRNHSTEAALT